MMIEVLILRFNQTPKFNFNVNEDMTINYKNVVEKTKELVIEFEKFKRSDHTLSSKYST